MTTTRPWFCARYDPTTGWRCPAGTHDTVTAYRMGCRSAAAGEDRRLYHKRWREGRHVARTSTNYIGLVRRIEAAALAGWSQRAMEIETGISARTFWMLTTGKQRYITTSLRDQLVPALERLAMTPRASARVRSWARDRGYVPLLAWDDIDDPDAVPAQVDELRDEIVALTARGFTQAQIAQRLGRSPAVVRKRLGNVRDVAVELDEHLLSEAVAGRVPFGELSDVEQDVVVERLWAHFLPICELEDKPGNEVAARLGVDLLTVQRIHANRRMRELRADREAS